MHTISQEYLIKLPIGYSVFLLLLQLLFFHLNLSLNSLFRFTFSLVSLTRGLFKGRENKNHEYSYAAFCELKTASFGKNK